ncbi:MAG: hypothetical protein WD185_03675, partial [Sneathiella sp.]
MGIFGRKTSSGGSGLNSETEAGFGEAVLITSLADAHLLMMVAAERGIELDEDVTGTILDTDEAVAKKMMTPAIANGFWQAYESLSDSLSPISIDSIRATHDLRQLRSGVWGYIQGKMYVPFSRKAVFRYKLLSTLTLLSLITLQVFWAIGNTLVTDIKEQSDRISTLKSQLNIAGDKQSQQHARTLSERIEARKAIENVTSDAAIGSPVTLPTTPPTAQELN